MPDLTLAIHRRNARIRAHQANGVPVAGGWVRAGADLSDTYRIVLGCSACGGRSPSWYHGANTSRRYGSLAESLDAGERYAVEVFARRRCPHLAPLLAAEDPPAVLALTDLEILAGEGP